MWDLIALDDSAKVWLYQADRAIEPAQVGSVKGEIQRFVESWTSHNAQLKAYGSLFHYRFIGLFVDESMAGASGCSIDKSVHFLQDLGRRYDRDFMNRNYFYYLQDDVIDFVEQPALSTAYSDGRVNDDTLFFDNLVRTKGEFLTEWLKPLGQSWHHRFL